MKWLRWQSGRQGTGYGKMLLAIGTFPLPFDFYLLKFPPGCEVPEHRDPVKPGFRHYRFNLTVWKPKSGGIFKSEKTIINWRRFQFFRPDLYTHSATKVQGNTWYILSFGFLLKEK